ncbi:peptidoglycan-binding protein [Streptomyces sp. NPDC007000]|uniref:peptidoglycan-binding protein n=1 Tax=Streptomyces sp. NPDC007000 TaxID=3155357 RepID=UPI0033EAF134
MSRWKALPAELDPSARNLVVRLRWLKDHSGLSLRQLASKSGYSASSWERYLGGRSLPPRGAVEALASINGEEPSRLLAAWEVAAEAWNGRTATAPPASTADTAPAPAPAPAAEPITAVPAEPPGPTAGHTADPVRGRAFQVAVAAGVAALLLAASAAAVLVGRMGTDGGAATSPTSSAAAAMSSPSAVPGYTCRVERVDGLWYAGQSDTKEELLANGYAGPEVAEVQCLLERAGYAPGDIDGIYGPLTERAVTRLQRDAGLVVDGIVGPHTWGALRG